MRPIEEAAQQPFAEALQPVSSMASHLTIERLVCLHDGGA